MVPYGSPTYVSYRRERSFRENGVLKYIQKKLLQERSLSQTAILCNGASQRRALGSKNVKPVM